MIITQKTQDGANLYTFEARKVKYSIVANGDSFAVWTQRGRFPTPPRVMTLADMLAGNNKTLRGFAQVVTA